MIIINLIWPENVEVNVVFISYEHCHGVSHSQSDHFILIANITQIISDVITLS